MALFILDAPLLCWKTHTGIRGYHTAKQSNSGQTWVGKKIKKEKTTGWKEHAKGETRMNTEEKNNEQKLLLLCPLPSQQCPKGEGLQWEQEGPGEEEEQILCTGRNAEDWSAQKYAQEQVV